MDKPKLVIFILALWLPIYTSARADINENDLQRIGLEYWHSQLAEIISVTSNEIKISQGIMTLGHDSYQLWSVFDAMANYESELYYNPSQYNSFSSDYGDKLYNLPVESVSSERCDLDKAVIRYDKSDGIYAWSKTLDQLNDELLNSQGLKYTSSKTFGHESNPNEQASYTVKVDVDYEQFTVFYAKPYGSDIHNTQLQGYTPWYSPCVLPYVFSQKQDEKESRLNQTTALVVANKGKQCVSILNPAQVHHDCTTLSVPAIIAVITVPLVDLYAQIP
ncbi:hypothetical protein RJ45_19900 [Photobacterium gaetbulicola]|uniref:Uncharacterized protein n=1 Tax=Photobacterium gaetbulicola TaxID=1295392 RepID=A0A0B9GAT3_9GAMM|nr:hypothetical protein [Photobacterium gaetbulicola]KHT62020.1 hypothetical protein RJ45_19900 [Photobacterium gaetbulicola]